MHFKKFILASSFMFFVACTQNQPGEQEAGQPADSTADHRKDIEALFPAPGEEVFKTNCITCHSLRYIEMQPPFSRKTWEKIVDKMIKNFGAPIPDSSVKVIVDYLVAVKGK